MTSSLFSSNSSTLNNILAKTFSLFGVLVMSVKIVYNLFLAVYPEQADARESLATAYLKTNKYALANTSYALAYKASPDIIIFSFGYSFLIFIANRLNALSSQSCLNLGLLKLFFSITTPKLLSNSSSL